MADEQQNSDSMEEPEATQTWISEPSVNRHRPASGKSQDISHVLASTFKELYTRDIIGKDMLANLIKTKSGQSVYHDKYVEELQQVYYEHRRHIQEADVLEGHIIQARAKAAAKESHARRRSKEDVCDHLSVEAALTWCIDNDLLEMNNLICPRDYLPCQKPHSVPPPPVKLDPAKPTISFTMHTSKEPRDDGYSLIPSLQRGTNETEVTMTFDSFSDAPQRKNAHREKRNQAKPKPKWKGVPSAKDKAEMMEDLQKLKERHTFLLNPHFLPPNAHPGGKSLIQSRTKAARTEREDQSSSDVIVPVFVANPSAVVFTEYSVGQVYETTLELRNMTSSSRNVRVIPPTTPYFSIGLGRFPGEGGVVAPGMSCKYAVRFAPDSLGDFEDFIVVETQNEHQLVVPFMGRRPPPILTLPRVLDCGYCLIGGVKFVEFLCENVGLSAGTFTIIPKSQWPTSNLRPVAKTYFSEQPPFAISPSLFVLQPAEAIVVEVVFFPISAERGSQDFTIVCDNCQVKHISIEGEGQQIAIKLASVSGEEDEHPVFGEVHDLTAEHCVHFTSCNPHAVQQKVITVRNNVHLELPFHWQILQPNLHPLLPGEAPRHSHVQFHPATDDVFHVSPATGLLGPCQEQEFLLTFCPKELTDYHSVCHLVLRDVPQSQPEPSEASSGLQPVRTGSKLSDVIVMEIEVKGSTEPYKVQLDPYAVIIPGEVFICTTTQKKFKMWNHSKTFICFQWERLISSCHIIEVEPPTGRIEQNECLDLDLIVTGVEPERLMTSLVCHVEHHEEPIVLLLEVSFKGPAVTVSVPSVDFGLVELGDQAQTTVVLTNTTQLEASWTMGEIPHGQRDVQISVKPHRGVLPPTASCSVDVVFRPHFPQQLETHLELAVDHGQGRCLSVRADVQSPQVCLLNCELLLSEVYVGVPARGAVTLFNQTLLPSHFKWMDQLQGEKTSLCSASFDPPSGTLPPNASTEIAVDFTSHTDELLEVAALCEVQGMKSRLVLRILVPHPKTLSVSYSLPSVSSVRDGETPSALVLDFGSDVVLKKAVTEQLLITNQTAIPATFTVEAEYFTCRHASKPNKPKKQGKSVSYVKKPLHSFQAKKVEEKAHEDFVSGLLAHGKGAAFLVLPNTGTLGPFQTQVVDVTAYTDMWGEYRDRLICKVGDLEPTLIPMQMTVNGCPLYFQMTGPQLDDQNQGPIIHFGRHVSGGDTVSRSLRINNPTLFDIRVDWETYNVDNDSRKLVDVLVAFGEAFPLKDADGNEAMAAALSFCDGDDEETAGRSPTSEATSSSLRSQSETEEEEFIDDYDGIDESLYPRPVEQKLISVHIWPHLGSRSDYPYCITPQQIVIPAKGSSTFHVSFTPLTLSNPASESKCVGFALGYMSLDSKMAACVPGKVGRAQGLDLEPVRMDLWAAVKPAALLVQMEEDDGVLDFRASAGDLLRARSETELAVWDFDITRSLQLINNSEMVLHFRLKTQPPFTLLKAQPRDGPGSCGNVTSADSQSVVLQQQKSVQVKVAFHCSLPLLDHAGQTDEDVPPGVTLIHDVESGEKKLRFQQKLLIHYSNNSMQTVPLQAHLDLSTLRLSTQSVHFGSCYVGHTRTKEVKLYCCGSHTYWKSVVGDGDLAVFAVTPDFGLLKAKTRHVVTCSQLLQIHFTPSEDREFRATLLIQSPLVKADLTLQLQGTGSYDEAFRTD